MMDRKLFQDTFSMLHASENRIQEVLSMAEEKNTHKTRRVSRAALLTAAVVASLSVCAGAANAATGGALAAAIELHISEVLHINDYKSEVKTEEGSNITIYTADVDLVREGDRVILTVGDERTDITDKLNANGSYTCDRTDGETTCHIEVMPDDVDGPDARWYHPDEWRYEATIIDPSLKDENGEISTTFIGSTYKDDECFDGYLYSTVETDKDGNKTGVIYFTDEEMAPEDLIEQ